MEGNEGKEGETIERERLYRGIVCAAGYERAEKERQSEREREGGVVWGRDEVGEGRLAEINV